MFRVFTAPALVMVLLTCSGLLYGQGIPDAPAPQTPQAGGENSSAGEVWPPLIYLLDEDGKPTIPYLPIDWREFHRARNAANDEVPGYLLSELHLTATARDKLVEIEARLIISVLRNGRQLVPIKLGNAHFRTQPKAGDAEVRARFVEQHGEYELMLDGKRDRDVTVTFSLLAPLSRLGEFSKLQLDLPRATLSSMELTLPTTESLVTTAAGGMTFQQRQEDGATTLQFDGLVPKFAFSWRPEPQVPTENVAALEVEGTIDVHVASTGTVTSDAQLAFSTFQRPLARARVRLPQDTFWIEPDVGSEEYTVVPLGRAADGRRELEITFATPTPTPPPIRLLVEADRPDNVQNAAYALAGFEVVGATSEYGQVNLFSQGDHRLAWNVGELAQRTITAEDARASFVYYEPNQIQLAIARQSREVMVEPVYIVNVGAGQATMTAIFRVRTGGASLADLTLDLGPWTLEGLGKDPQNVIDNGDDLPPGGGSIQLPLSDAPNEFEIAIIASLPFDTTLAVLPEDAVLGPESALALTFPIPQGVARLVQPTVAFVSDPDVVVAPLREDEDPYNVVNPPKSVSDEVDPAASPICFRMRSTGPPAPLRIAAARLERMVSVVCDTDIVEVGAESLRISQRMQWKVDEVQLPRVLLTMPKHVYVLGDPQISLDGTPCVVKRYPTFGDDVLQRYLVQIALPPRIGNFELTVTYNWENTEPTMDQVLVDLVLPKRDTSALVERMRFSNRLRKPRVQGYQISLWEGGNANLAYQWLAAGELAILDSEVEARTDNFLSQIPLTIERVGTPVETTSFGELIEQSWYQTWFTDSDRTDRAVFRLRGVDKDVRIAMPEDTNFRKLHAWVDGEKVEFLREGTQNILLNVPARAAEHVVEIRTTREGRRPAGVLETRVPVVDGADMIGQWYWHVVIPRNEAVVAWPRKLTRAHYWDWRQLIPRVRPQLNQTELENWSGATPSTSRVLLGSNEYLFGAIGEPGELWIRTTPLPLYVLAVAGAILVFGLVLLQARRRHRIWMMCVAGVVISGVLVIHPSYGAIGGQVIVLGTSLVIVSGVVRWLLWGSDPRPRLVATGSTRTVQQEGAPTDEELRSTMLATDLPVSRGGE